jgi:hypothetical protein
MLVLLAASTTDVLFLITAILGAGFLATLLGGLGLYIWGALKEGGVIRLAAFRKSLAGAETKDAGAEKEDAGAETKDDQLEKGLLKAIGDAWKVVFSKKGYRRAQRLMAAGILLWTLSAVFGLACLGTAVGAVVANNNGNGGTTQTGTTTGTTATSTTSK